MRKSCYTATALILLLLSCWACMEIHPLTPRKDPPLLTGGSETCQPPSLEKNIVGTWHFESTMNANTALTSGTITFNADGTIIDPDSLFDATIGDYPVVSKTYNPKYPNPTTGLNDYFFVTINTKQDKVGFYFSLVSNECGRIFFRLGNSGNNLVRIILTR